MTVAARIAANFVSAPITFSHPLSGEIVELRKASEHGNTDQTQDKEIEERKIQKVRFHISLSESNRLRMPPRKRKASKSVCPTNAASGPGHAKPSLAWSQVSHRLHLPYGNSAPSRREACIWTS
jgi:hypothetical protein